MALISPTSSSIWLSILSKENISQSSRAMYLQLRISKIALNNLILTEKAENISK